MPAELHFWHPSHLSHARGNLTWRHVNTLNSPISSSSWLGNGAALADVYELIFTKSGSTVTVTVNALIHGSKNPYHNMGGSLVAIADGSTVNTRIVPGVGLVLSASTDTGWKARVSVGNYLADDGTYEQFFGAGIVEEGVATTGKRVAVKNVGADDAASIVIYSCPGIYWTGTNADSIIKLIGTHTNPSRHKMAIPGSYTISFADWKNAPSGSGKKSCDIRVDGNVAVNDAELDGITTYQYGVSGYDDANDRLKGLRIVLQDTTTDPSAITATLVVAASGYTYQQFAADSGGTPGSYAFQDVTIGTITAGSAGYFWVRFLPPEGAGPGAIRHAIPKIRCLSI